MKLKSIVNYNIDSLKNSLLIYYAIFISVCVALVIISRNSNGTVSSSGLEVSSAIFIFIVGLNSFKENFYFMKGNNVSRRDFIYGSALSIIPVALFMSIIDIIINRIYNLFIKCPTNYDMIYTLRRGEWYSTTDWVQINSIEILFNTFIFQASVYIVLFSLGLLITIIYYKCNSFMKVIVSVVPVALFILLNVIGTVYPNLIDKINSFITTIFGWNTRNSYAAIFTFIVFYMILIVASRLLTKKSIIK